MPSQARRTAAFFGAPARAPRRAATGRADVAARELARGRRGRSRVPTGRSRRPARVPALAAPGGAGLFRRVSAAICSCATAACEAPSSSRTGRCATSRLHGRPAKAARSTSGAGVASPKVARFAAMHDLVGAEFLAGIPGTVGGALAMNAGCYGGGDLGRRAQSDDRRSRREPARAHARPLSHRLSHGEAAAISRSP